MLDQSGAASLEDLVILTSKESKPEKEFLFWCERRSPPFRILIQRTRGLKMDLRTTCSEDKNGWCARNACGYSYCMCCSLDEQMLDVGEGGAFFHKHASRGSFHHLFFGSLSEGIKDKE